MSQQKSALEKLMDERKSVRKYEPGVTIPVRQFNIFYSKQHQLLHQVTYSLGASLLLTIRSKRKSCASLDLIRNKLKHHLQ